MFKIVAATNQFLIQISRNFRSSRRFSHFEHTRAADGRVVIRIDDNISVAY